MTEFDRQAVGKVVQETSVVLAAHRGGRLRIRARSRDGREIAAACTVRTLRGAKVDVGFFRRDGRSMAWALGLPEGGASEVDRALPPGSYAVEVTTAVARQVREVHLLAGQTTEVEIDLTAK